MLELSKLYIYLSVLTQVNKFFLQLVNLSIVAHQLQSSPRIQQYLDNHGI